MKHFWFKLKTWLFPPKRIVIYDVPLTNVFGFNTWTGNYVEISIVNNGLHFDFWHAHDSMFFLNARKCKSLYYFLTDVNSAELWSATDNGVIFEISKKVGRKSAHIAIKDGHWTCIEMGEKDIIGLIAMMKRMN